MSTFFDFETDFIATMRCIPMVVRYNLDTCGVKLKLEHWLAFTPPEREALAIAPCDTPTAIAAYRDKVQQLVTHYQGTPAKLLAIDAAPAWLNPDCVPEPLQAKAQELQQTMTVAQWRSLTPLQRFALIKLSRPSHENKNFLPAWQEFNL